MAASMKVTIVWPPALTVTVAVPAARLLLTSNPALGKVLTPVNTVPAGIVSVTTTEPAGPLLAIHRCHLAQSQPQQLLVFQQR